MLPEDAEGAEGGNGEDQEAQRLVQEEVGGGERGRGRVASQLNEVRVGDQHHEGKDRTAPSATRAWVRNCRQVSRIIEPPLMHVGRCAPPRLTHSCKPAPESSRLISSTLQAGSKIGPSVRTRSVLCHSVWLASMTS